MADAEFELVSLVQRRRETVKERRGDIDDLAAFLTHEVPVQVAKVVNGGA